MSLRTNLKIYKSVLLSLLFSLPLFPVLGNTGVVFMSPIKLDDSGPSVLALQKLLNSDPDTMISLSGAGSPNNETEYFGEKTKNAVIRFQEKYKADVLVPSGLSYGTGYVGPMTIKKLNNLNNLKALVPKNTPKNDTNYENTGYNTKNTKPFSRENNSVTPSSDVLSKDDPNYVSISADNGQSAKISLKWDPNKGETNPNMENIDGFLEAVRKVGKEQAYSSDDIKKAEEAILEQVATTTNLKALFVKENIEKGGFVPISGSETEKFLRENAKNPFKNILAQISDIFLPKAEAISGLPFGGRVGGSILCTCSGNWLMFLMPTRPSFVFLLTHYSGAQMYRNFNVPFTLNILGKYVPAGAPCMMYAGLFCVPIPSQGMTTPMIGSS